MAATKFPAVEEVLFLHEEIIKRYGGSTGLRDLGLLESALYRPRSGYYATLSEQAAALFQSLASNHCFVDGNKRVAFATTAIFLRLNGYSIKVSADEGDKFIVEQLIVKKLELAEIASWIEKHVKKV